MRAMSPGEKCSLFCVIVLNVWVGMVVAPANGTEITIHTFHGGRDGADPWSALIADRSGNLYGTTLGGGNGRCSCGTIFEITPQGQVSVLYSFKSGSDGAAPFGGLIIDGTGNLYGTTAIGGGSGCDGKGCGTVFKLSGTTETVLYAFQGGSDGLEPDGALAMDGNANLYGATSNGGSYNGANCNQVGCGTVFKLEPDGTKTTLYRFQSGSDGSEPKGGVILDNSGNLYGTTYEGGGAGCNPYGCGTVFKISQGGSESVLYGFQGASDGGVPDAGVIIDGSGNLYGTTSSGGTTSCFADSYCGTVFEIPSGGTETVLYNFQGGRDGWQPHSNLKMDEAGNLYGTTYFGGGERAVNTRSISPLAAQCSSLRPTAPRPCFTRSTDATANIRLQDCFLAIMVRSTEPRQKAATIVATASCSS